MRSQISIEVMASMAIALFIALFLSECLLGMHASFAKAENSASAAAAGANRDLSEMLNRPIPGGA
jgi:hypothetical protein